MSVISGGTNDAANLAWSCLWCNTWPGERIPGATDHGGIQPVGGKVADDVRDWISPVEPEDQEAAREARRRLRGETDKSLYRFFQIFDEEHENYEDAYADAMEPPESFIEGTTMERQ